jgi:hypothetical protein
MHFLHIALLLKLPLLEHIPHMPRYNGLIALKKLDHLGLVQPDGISLQMHFKGGHPVRGLVNNDLPLIFRWVHQHDLVKTLRTLVVKDNRGHCHLLSVYARLDPAVHPFFRP